MTLALGLSLYENFNYFPLIILHWQFAEYQLSLYDVALHLEMLGDFI